MWYNPCLWKSMSMWWLWQMISVAGHQIELCYCLGFGPWSFLPPTFAMLSWRRQCSSCPSTCCVALSNLVTMLLLAPLSAHFYFRSVQPHLHGNMNLWVFTRRQLLLVVTLWWFTLINLLKTVCRLWGQQRDSVQRLLAFCKHFSCQHCPRWIDPKACLMLLL